jgi:hypothetical protein
MAVGSTSTNQIAKQQTQLNAPREFLVRLGVLLTTFQLAYRTTLPDAELRLWRETLEGYSITEIESALSELLRCPPKQQLDDGTIQVWRGMPKLPDVIETIFAMRETAAEAAKQSNVERSPDPNCSKCVQGWIREGNRVKKCVCWAPRPKIEARPQLMPAVDDRKTLADVLKTAAMDIPEATPEKLAKPFPETLKYSTYSPSQEEIDQKKAEALKLAEKFQAEERP